MGMLPAALGRNVGHGALQVFQQRLLHALAGHIAGDGRILAPVSYTHLDVYKRQFLTLAAGVGRIFNGDQFAHEDVAGIIDVYKRQAAERFTDFVKDSLSKL